MPRFRALRLLPLAKYADVISANVDSAKLMPSGTSAVGSAKRWTQAADSLALLAPFREAACPLSAVIDAVWFVPAVKHPPKRRFATDKPYYTWFWLKKQEEIVIIGRI